VAIIWQKQIGDTSYEVRTAGNTRRLYTNGVFHSQFNSRHPVTGGIWDLLLLPAFFYPDKNYQRILVLGVGGGAIIKQFQYFLQPNKIIGIELNSTHIYIAKRFFNVQGNNVDLIKADAVQWLKNYRGKPFDIIVDDLFGEEQGEPVRAVVADKSWFNCLINNLTAEGLLVSNFVSKKEFKRSAFCTDKSVRKKIHSAYTLAAPLHENVIAAFVRQPTSSKILRKSLGSIPELNPELKTSKLKYSVREVK